jgi:hypothetical protein
MYLICDEGAGPETEYAPIRGLIWIAAVWTFPYGLALHSRMGRGWGLVEKTRKFFLVQLAA